MNYNYSQSNLTKPNSHTLINNIHIPHKYEHNLSQTLTDSQSQNPKTPSNSHTQK